jgi:hypothetical protein
MVAILTGLARAVVDMLFDAAADGRRMGDRLRQDRFAVRDSRSTDWGRQPRPR